jgi:phage-related baseplate assembly protein
LTDDVEVNDGTILPIDVDMVVVMFKNADAGTIKEEVDSAVESFFDLSQWNMGQPLYVSSLYDKIMSINGVKFVNIFNPSDDILPEKDVGEVTGATTVGFSELITLGNKSIRLYYEQ